MEFMFYGHHDSTYKKIFVDIVLHHVLQMTKSWRKRMYVRLSMWLVILAGILHLLCLIKGNRGTSVFQPLARDFIDQNVFYIGKKN